jgi:hypothetical protein
MASHAGGTDAEVDAVLVRRALAAVAMWHGTVLAREALGLVAHEAEPLRRALLRRVSAAEREAPRHRRAAVARLAADARRALVARCGAGTERALGELAASDASGEAWLAAVAACVEGDGTGPRGEKADPASGSARKLPASAADDSRLTPGALLLVTPCTVRDSSS